MQKFMVMYLAPAAMMAEWMKKPESERKDEEAKMMSEWKVWTAAHAGMIKESNATGKTMRVTKDGATATSNDLMLYSVIEAESPEAAAEAFKNHPHFGIPEATIEIMPIRPM
jgi:hypothetical protein